MTKPLYDALGIEETASPADIKRAHRRAVKKAHPDMNGGSHEEFQKVQRAYLVLSDAARRESYDKTGKIEDAEPDNREAQARDIVARCVTQALEASEQTVFREDIFKGFRERALQPAINKILQDKEKWKRAIVRNDKFLSKVTRKKKTGLDLVTQLIKGMNAEFERNVIRCDEAVAVHQRAIEIVADYEYEFEKGQTVMDVPPAVFLRMFHNSSTWGA